MSENQTSESAALKGKVIVFVRRTDDGEGRDLTFARPGDISAAELLKNDLAIDGDVVVISVGIEIEEEGHLYTAPGFGNYGDLSSALLAVEQWLVEFLGEHGYEVAFC